MAVIFNIPEDIVALTEDKGVGEVTLDIGQGSGLVEHVGEVVVGDRSSFGGEHQRGVIDTRLRKTSGLGVRIVVRFVRVSCTGI